MLFASRRSGQLHARAVYTRLCCTPEPCIIIYNYIHRALLHARAVPVYNIYIYLYTALLHARARMHGVVPA